MNPAIKRCVQSCKMSSLFGASLQLSVQLNLSVQKVTAIQIAITWWLLCTRINRITPSNIATDRNITASAVYIAGLILIIHCTLIITVKNLLIFTHKFYTSHIDIHIKPCQKVYPIIKHKRQYNMLTTEQQQSMFKMLTLFNATHHYPVRPRTAWNRINTTVYAFRFHILSCRVACSVVRRCFRLVSAFSYSARALKNWKWRTRWRHKTVTSRLPLLSNSKRRISSHLIVPQTEPPNVWDVLKQPLQPRVGSSKLSYTQQAILGHS